LSTGYRAVGWNRQKKIYDGVMLGGVLLYVGGFAALGLAWRPDLTAETLLIRGLGSAALLLLHVLLTIGPMARLDPRFLPLLYNRRHMGVTVFLLGLLHGGLATLQFHAFGDENPLVSVLTATPWGQPSALPFAPFGLLALLIFFGMAATSHDFWLRLLTAPVWKRLHMLVYLAWASLELHVAFGLLRSERSPVLLGLLCFGALWVAGLHLLAALRERATDAPLVDPPEADGFVRAVDVEDIPEGRARIVCLSGERVAIFRYEGRISAISNVCRHQNGPLGEGRVVDGCVTCPWHGYQYLPDTGASPPPFTEKVPTFRVRVAGHAVYVHPTPLPAGTRVEPALIAANTRSPDSGPPQPFYIGWQDRMPAPLARAVRGLTLRRLLLAAGVCGLFVSSLSATLPSRFDFGHPREFEGVIANLPNPLLLVSRPDATTPSSSAWLLVRPYKFGADDLFSGLEGHRVRLSGTLAWLDERTLLEVVPESVQDLGPATVDLRERPVGKVRLRGEIVDSKCYLGVMNPGDLNVHRDCAARCLSGGVPPAFVVQDSLGARRAILLVGAGGESVNQAALAVVAEPLEITGQLSQLGELYVLRADPSSWRRL